MKRLTAAAIATVMFLTGTATVSAGPGRGDGWNNMSYGQGYKKGPRDGGRCAPGSRMSGALNLTDKQTEQLRVIDDKYLTQRRALRDKSFDSRRKMRDLMNKDDVKESQLRKLVNEQGKIKVDMIMLQKKIDLEKRKVLTKEQQEKWKQMRGSGYGRR